MKKLAGITLVAALFCFSAISPAHAMVNLKNVQVSKDDQVDLLFDKKVSKGQIKVDYFRDIIQLSIKNVSIYPAKILTVKGNNLTKVFAYQYTPKLIRARLSVKGKAEDYRNRLKLSSNGKQLIVKIKPAAQKEENITIQAAQATRATPKSNAGKSGGSKKLTGKKLKPLKEDELLKRIFNASPDGKSSKGKGKELPNPVSSFFWMGLALMAVAGLAFGYKKFVRGSGGKTRIPDTVAKSNWISKLTSNRFGGNKKMINVVSTHYLGPKKSIAVVDVKGQTLVLGVTNESINLITKLKEERAALATGFDLDEEDDIDADMGSGAETAGPVFSDILMDENTKPVGTKPEVASAQAMAQDPNASVRARIRQKMAGMKTL